MKKTQHGIECPALITPEDGKASFRCGHFYRWYGHANEPPPCTSCQHEWTDNEIRDFISETHKKPGRPANKPAHSVGT